jgi:acetoacetyl-CoA synthetase
MSSQQKPQPLWTPDARFIAESRMKNYMDWLAEKKNLRFKNYDDLYLWSVDQVEAFWLSIWEYFDVESHSPFGKVLSSLNMPGARWFEGATLNYAEHIFSARNTQHPAIIFKSEKVENVEISWEELAGQVGSFQTYLREVGVGKGDRVVAYLPNIPEATVGFLASCSLGAVWSSCSPDFGVNSVVERFQQISPKVLITVDGYHYNGKSFSKIDAVKELVSALPSVEKVVVIPYLDPNRLQFDIPKSVTWVSTFRPAGVSKLSFEPVPFNHPIWVLYSSGTTGKPKAMTHSHGGSLLEHLKYLALHNDVKPGERFFWFTTTGWMMWNFVQASMLAGATIVLYDGSPGYPDLNVLWEFAEKAKIHHFGTSAPYLVTCMKNDLHPGRDFDLSGMRSIGSTGSPLPPEAFDWVYERVTRQVWLCSMAGGSDVCTAWVGGCPTRPVYRGEIQCRCLGADLVAFDESGQLLTGEVGELVVRKPMPSMPIYFWNDPKNERYLASYFDVFPGVWRHGDWIDVTERDSVVMLGRSDATLNRQGVRIGTAEIYRAVDKVKGVKDSLIIHLEMEGGTDFMPLFVMLEDGVSLDDTLRKQINQTLRSEYSPRHVPDAIFEIPEIPYTLSGKKMETPVKKILLGKDPQHAAAKDSMKNPDSLEYFVRFRKEVKSAVH